MVLTRFAGKQMARKPHSKPEVEAALNHAEQGGWRIEPGGSHVIACRCGEFCIASIWSTPRNAGNHARQIRRVVDNCTIHRTRSALH